MSWTFSLRATFPTVVTLAKVASFPPTVCIPLALQWRNLQIYVMRSQLNRFDFVSNSGGAHDDVEQDGIVGGLGPASVGNFGPLDVVYWSTHRRLYYHTYLLLLSCCHLSIA